MKPWSYIWLEFGLFSTIMYIYIYILIVFKQIAWKTLWHWRIIQATSTYSSQTRTLYRSIHDDVIKWKYFPRYWPFVREIHRSPVNFPHKGQWRGALMFTLICAQMNGWVNNGEAGDLRRYLAHYDVIVMHICWWWIIFTALYWYSLRLQMGHLVLNINLWHNWLHDDVIKWKHYLRYWPFVRGIQRSPVNSPHKGQGRGPLMLSLICTRINGWVNNGEAGDLRRHRAHYDVTVMYLSVWSE